MSGWRGEGGQQGASGGRGVHARRAGGGPLARRGIGGRLVPAVPTPPSAERARHPATTTTMKRKVRGGGEHTPWLRLSRGFELTALPPLCALAQFQAPRAVGSAAAAATTAAAARRPFRVPALAHLAPPAPPGSVQTEEHGAGGTFGAASAAAACSSPPSAAAPAPPFAAAAPPPPPPAAARVERLDPVPPASLPTLAGRAARLPSAAGVIGEGAGARVQGGARAPAPGCCTHLPKGVTTSPCRCYARSQRARGGGAARGPAPADPRSAGEPGGGGRCCRGGARAALWRGQQQRGARGRRPGGSCTWLA